MKRFRSFTLPSAWLLLLLQRTPVVRLAATAGEFVAPSRVVALLKAAISTAVSLGAVHSLAGATQLVASQASPVTVAVGATVQIALNVTGAQTPAASWTISGTVPPGLSFSGRTSGIVNISTLILSGTPTTPGTYTINLLAWERTNGGGDRSSIFPYTVIVTGVATVAPTITSQPASQSVTAGGTASFSVSATGNPAPTYQWRKDGTALAGATAATLTLTNVQAADAGVYTALAVNSAGSLTTLPATLTVAPAVTGPTLTLQPASQHLAAGASGALSVAASGTGLSYQWKKDGAALPGATNSTLPLANATAATMGFYSAVVTSPTGSTASAIAIVTVATGTSSRLINVSTRGYVPAGGALTPGFVLQGNTTKALVIRAVGPTLSAFGVAGTLADPVMDVIPLGSSTAIASNDNWGGSSALSTAFSRVGAFALAASSSNDASVETSLNTTGASGYTVRITSKNAAAEGVALAEIYDEEALSSAVRLVNVSTSGFVGSGDQALVPGFVIGGDAPKQLLIRAVGPGLTQFGVSGVLADPQLSLVPLGRDFAIATNDNWGGGTALQTAFTQAGAFALPSGSKDAVVVVRLPPGGYTVVVSGVGATTGTALVEVYDLDP
ncbi:immunoglobulin domain-containing protein [Horticoccus sp. 23ND18S-11]|uniref:immunoglobulin domain-containing protein n=1 Tax=Horticoccus sp. 23ND18S-11 TaxID=3391832 RepID=UPI0039C94F08